MARGRVLGVPRHAARTDNASLPYVAAALIVLFTPILFLFAVIVYRIIRPQEKIGEVYERNLAEEAMLAEVGVETVKSCPCSRRVHDEWIICPTCRTRLNRVCGTAVAWWGSTGRCARGVARTFERRDVPRRPPSRRCPLRS